MSWACSKVLPVVALMMAWAVWSAVAILDLCGGAGHVVLDDYVGLIVTVLGVMCMMGWEALALFSAVGTARV
jgi:hypothetical protein